MDSSTILGFMEDISSDIDMADMVKLLLLTKLEKKYEESIQFEKDNEWE